MKLQNLFLLLFTFLVFSCGDSTAEECVTLNFSEEFSDELAELSTATSAYVSDPSTENCDAVKSAYSDYIDAVESFEDCAREAGQLEEWQMSLDDARDSLNDIC